MKFTPENCNGDVLRLARGNAIDLSRVLSTRRVDVGEREGAVELFMSAIGALTRPQARAKLAEYAGVHRWNAATMGAVLRAMRAHFKD